MSSIPRPEYPRPQFVRTDPAAGSPRWLCLNGEWDFEIDAGDSGYERGLAAADATLSRRILVPFCPESSLSGIGYTDFMNAVWYRRTVRIPDEWKGDAVLVHFQAVDYDSTVWAISERTNGKPVELVRHRGGFTPFTVTLAGIADGGEEVTLILRARDPLRDEPAARGKQSNAYAPHDCVYTRTTGIWQTVWMEPVPVPASLKRPRITPDVAQGAFHLELPLTNNPKGYRVRATVKDDKGEIVTASARADLDFAPRLSLLIPEDRQRLWAIKDPFLYDLVIELLDPLGNVVDRLDSYGGLRSVSIEGKKVKINGESVFQRLVLDQGYYPDSVMTAPDDEALVRDIQISMEIGFNGARLHQKVFEERFLYHADRLGYLVWGEFADWGCGGFGPSEDHQQPGVTYVAQFLESLERDYSHPAIIGWCPLNETFQKMRDRITNLDDATRAMFLATKAMDTTRPVLDVSGYSHRVRETDIYDSHDYITEDNFSIGLLNFRTRQGAEPWLPFVNPQYPHAADQRTAIWSVPYAGQPYFCSEFGGFKWKYRPDEEHEEAAPDLMAGDTWGYGPAPRTKEEFYERLEATCCILLTNVNMFGFCYTQLTDIFPEENGLFTLDRHPKFDSERLRRIIGQPAAIEEA